jgi:hypothetical protein
MRRATFCQALFVNSYVPMMQYEFSKGHFCRMAARARDGADPHVVLNMSGAEPSKP